MKTKYEIDKIKNVVLYALKKYPEGIDNIRLFKILYFSHREYLSKYGKILFPDTFKARTYGPVPSLSHKVIKLAENTAEGNDRSVDLESFCLSIKVQNSLVFALAEPDTDYLSKKECAILDKWCEDCREKDSIKELSPLSHDDAYKEAYKNSQLDPQKDRLTNMDIAKAGGASEEMLSYIREKEIMSMQLA